jgi:hypothetical protein
MLEHSFLGCKSDFESMVNVQRTGSSGEKRRYTGMVGGKASDRTNHTKPPKQ